MSGPILPELDPIEHALDFHLQRHGVLVANVANGDTPGYQAKDLLFSRALEDVPMRATHRDHLGAEPNAVPFEVDALPGATRLDGNGVEIEKAMAQVTANRLRYETGIELARRRVAILRYAASDGGQG